MEIKAEQLRIGNYFEYCDIYYKSTGILPLATYYEPKEECGERLVYLSDIKPIPLHEEIILNCGFVADNWAGEEESNFYYIPDDDIIFSLNNDFQPTQDGFEICNYKINYLHELQNAYRFITGQELTVKL